jgi:hypothetical protein
VPSRARNATVAVALAIGGCTSHPSAPSAPALSLSTLSPDFGAIPVGGRSEPLRFSVANRGEAASGVLTIVIQGANATEFKLQRDQCSGQSVQEASDCTLEVELHPLTSGLKQATLTVLDPRGPDPAAAMQGTGIDAGLGITPATHAFAGTAVGTQGAPQTLVVRNAAVAPTGVIHTVVSGMHAAEFVVTRDTCDGQALALNASCVIDVRFAPAAAGTRQATITVSASPGGTAGTQLSGVGIT